MIVLYNENSIPGNHPVVQTSASKSDPRETDHSSLSWPFPTTPGDYYIIPGTGEIRPEILEKIEQISRGKY